MNQLHFALFTVVFVSTMLTTSFLEIQQNRYLLFEHHSLSYSHFLSTCCCEMRTGSCLICYLFRFDRSFWFGFLRWFGTGYHTMLTNGQRFCWTDICQVNRTQILKSFSSSIQENQWFIGSHCNSHSYFQFNFLCDWVIVCLCVCVIVRLHDYTHIFLFFFLLFFCEFFRELFFCYTLWKFFFNNDSVWFLRTSFSMFSVLTMMLVFLLWEERAYKTCW